MTVSLKSPRMAAVKIYYFVRDQFFSYCSGSTKGTLVNLSTSNQPLDAPEKFKRSGSSDVIISITYGFVLLFSCLASAYGCPTEDTILNDRPLAIIGKELTITCSFQLDSCDQAFWFLNNTLLSEDDGYRIAPVQHCVRSVAFIVNYTHDFGNIHCVMEGTLGNGDKQNCSSNSAVINVTGTTTDVLIEATTTDTGQADTTTAETERSEYEPTYFISSGTMTSGTDPGNKGNKTLIIVAKALVVVGAIILGYCAVQLVVMAVCHCYYKRKDKRRHEINERSIPTEDEEIQPPIFNKDDSLLPYPKQETGYQDQQQENDGVLPDDKIRPLVAATSLNKPDTLIIPQERFRPPVILKQAYDRTKEKSGGASYEMSEVALNIDGEDGLLPPAIKS